MARDGAVPQVGDIAVEIEFDGPTAFVCGIGGVADFHLNRCAEHPVAVDFRFNGQVRGGRLGICRLGVSRLGV